MVHAPQKIKVVQREKVRFRWKKKHFFAGQKRFFNLFHVFQYYIHEFFVSVIMLERSCAIIPDTQPIKN